MRAHAMSCVLRPLETLLLAACLTISSGVSAATIYAWTVADEIVMFDTNDPGTVQLVSMITGLPAGMNNRQDLAWDPATPDVLYALGHQLGFGNFWLLKIDIDTGVVFDAPVIGSGFGMSGLTYIGNANYTGLVASYRPGSNQETELCKLALNGILSDCISTGVDNQNLTWDSRNDVLHSRGTPAFVGGQTSLWAIPDFPNGAQSNLGAIPAGPIAYSAFDDRIYTYDYGPNELLYIDTTNGGAPIQVVSLGIVSGYQLVSMVAIDSAPSLACVGYEPPLDKGPVTVKKNRVLPLKGLLYNSNDQPIDDLSITARPVIQVLFDDGVSPAVDVTDEALPSGAGTDGNQFEFLDSKWHFNLTIRSYTAAGTYTVTMESGDTSEYLVDPTCTAQFVTR